MTDVLDSLSNVSQRPTGSKFRIFNMELTFDHFSSMFLVRDSSRTYIEIVRLPSKISTKLEASPGMYVSSGTLNVEFVNDYSDTAYHAMAHYLSTPRRYLKCLATTCECGAIHTSFPDSHSAWCPQFSSEI